MNLCTALYNKHQNVHWKRIYETTTSNGQIIRSYCHFYIQISNRPFHHSIPYDLFCFPNWSSATMKRRRRATFVYYYYKCVCKGESRSYLIGIEVELKIALMCFRRKWIEVDYHISKEKLTVFLAPAQNHSAFHCSSSVFIVLFMCILFKIYSTIHNFKLFFLLHIVYEFQHTLHTFDVHILYTQHNTNTSFSNSVDAIVR